MTEYAYTKIVDIAALDESVRAILGDALDGIIVTGEDQVVVITIDELSEAQEAALGDLVDEHDPDDPNTGAHIKLFRYIENAHDLGSVRIPPRSVDYITGLTRRLFRDETFVQGELQSVDYYAEQAVGSNGWPTYSDRILREEMVYTRDSLGFAKSRTTTIIWYREDDAPHELTKTLLKPYSLVESQKEGTTRRGNIISDLSLTVAGVLMQVLPTNATYPDAQAKIEVGRNFLQEHKIATDMFISAGKRDIVGIVKHAEDAWLAAVIGANGFTVRDLIIGQVDIWGIAGSV